MTEKLQALICTAEAYFDRENFIRYDQRSMDRVLQLTPRRRLLLPPEAATSDYSLFLDCSGFICSLFYQAFGCILPSSLTWHMIDQLKPCVLYRELTGEETSEDIKALSEEVKNSLTPGDIVTYELRNGNGHTMLYIGDNKLIHCTQNGIPAGYDYTVMKDLRGGTAIRADDSRLLFELNQDGTPWRNYLFRQNVRRYAISRLLDSVGDITNDSRARMSPACGLVCAVQVSHPGGRHASPKEVVSYSVKIRNKKNVDLPCEITFTPSEGVHIIDRGYVDTIVPAGASVCIPFRLIVPDTQEPYLDSPQVTVNSLQVFAPRVLTGSYGVDRFLSEEETISSLFFLHDSTQGYVLSRRTQSPCTDGALYSFFGGTGVITPSMAWESIGERSVSISIDDLRDGDRIVVSDDAVGKRSYSCVYSGGQLKGQFSFDGEEKSIKGSEAEEFIESLFGRFCFVVLRSS